MSLGFDSSPALYALLLGWQQYNVAWHLFVKTGLALTPFLVLLYQHTYQGGQSGAPDQLRLLMRDFWVMIFIVLIAVQPMVSLAPRDLTQTATSWHALPAPTGVKVPLWWYGVISISQGITHALIQQELPPLRHLLLQVRLARITDPHLRQQVKQFYHQCFLPARSRWLRQDHPQVDQDTRWMGSRTFIMEPGYYDTYHAQQPITGFPLHAARDWVNPDAQWGQPNCKDWWTDPQAGIKAQLKRMLPYTFWQHLRSLYSSDQEDQVIQSLLLNQPEHGYHASNGLISDWSFAHLVAAIGIESSQVSSYPKLYAILQAAPIVRALLLLVFYAFLPFGLLLSRYRIQAVVSGSIFLFSLIFWSVIWHWVQWMDQALIRALYGSWLFAQTPQAVLVETITDTMMIIAPIFWFTLMGSLGIAAGQGVGSALTSLLLPAEMAADKGSQLTSGVVNTVIKRGLT